ncbi:MAG: glycosyltransferase [Gemmatimonadales bacterium]|nr:MAG: glycosyltransferase [Gemmatimonadales bacterium]
MAGFLLRRSQMPPDRRLTILHLAAPGRAGGLESVVLDLTHGLGGLGHRTILGAVLDPGSEDHPVPARAEVLGVEVRRLVIPPRSYVLEYKRLRNLLAELRPDVVHTHGYRADLIGGFSARRAGVPWVSTVHGFTGGNKKNRLYEWLQVRAYRRAQAVVAVSRPLRDRLVNGGVPPAQVRILPNAWAPKALLSREEARRRLRLTGPAPVIGWVGRLTREKGADVFLEALAHIPDQPWTASIIGDGRERPALEAQAERLGIAERIRWHGLMPDAAGLYPAFDAWVLSSRTEGTPIALFEAMAARVPVVVTTVGGVPDVVSPFEALLVRSEDPAALAAGIATLLAGRDEAGARAEAAFRRLSAQHASEGWIAAHLELYRSLGPTVSTGT